MVRVIYPLLSTPASLQPGPGRPWSGRHSGGYRVVMTEYECLRDSYSLLRRSQRAFAADLFDGSSFND
eukprot:3956895-Pleurochrysis_carterae.AAC.1